MCLFPEENLLAEHLFSALSSACVTVCICSFSVSFDSCCHSRLASQGRSSQSHPHVSSPHVVLYVLGCTRATLMYSTVPLDSLLDMYTRGIPFLCTCPVYRWWSRLLLWTRQDQGRFYVSSVYLVINTELCQDTEYRIWTQISKVHSPVVKAADCRSAGPWFKSGWGTLFTFVTWYDKLTKHDFLMINFTSPITTSNRTITRKSVNMVAELDNGTVVWTLRGIGQRLECNSVVTKVLHAIALKITSEFGSSSVVD